MKRKYTPEPKYKPGEKGRPICPDKWIVGPDPVRREKYYAWLKHRAQASFRKEDYAITWPEWELIWPDTVWEQRGRHSDSVCLVMVDPEAGWHVTNCEVISRQTHLKKKRQRNNG
jgi:hypothetical protein